MTRPEDISERAWETTKAICGKWVSDYVNVRKETSLTDAWESVEEEHIRNIARAIDAETVRATSAERARWKPAAVYFERYCRDEADDAENCVCGQQQHVDAKNFRDAIRPIPVKPLDMWEAMDPHV